MTEVIEYLKPMGEWVLGQEERAYFEDDQWLKNDNLSHYKWAERINFSHEARAWLWSMFGRVWFVWGHWPFPTPVFFSDFFWPFSISQLFLVYELQVILRAMSLFLGLSMKIQQVSCGSSPYFIICFFGILGAITQKWVKCPSIFLLK